MASAAPSTPIKTESRAVGDVPSSERRTVDAREPGLARDVIILVATSLAMAALVVSACWVAWSFGAAPSEPPPSTAPRPELPAPRPTGLRVRTAATEAIHVDVFFGVKQTRLSAEAVAVLQDTAARIREEGGTWRVLVQGHADGQGAASYNLALAQRRAEAVRQFLVELGLAGDDIRVVTIGQAGTLCDDSTPACQQINRRVHLEVRRMVQASTPRAGTAPAGEIFREEGR